MSREPYDPVQAQIEVLERIATALEQMALDGSTRAAPSWNALADIHGPSYPEGPLPTPPPNLPVTPIMQPLPPVSAPFQFTAPTPTTACPVHHQPWKTVPAGVSKRTGNAYAAFQACPERDCNQRPA